jgi:hypothetical protein
VVPDVHRLDHGSRRRLRFDESRVARVGGRRRMPRRGHGRESRSTERNKERKQKNRINR